jgi:GNAT superfamily N-acetyltransferase
LWGQGKEEFSAQDWKDFYNKTLVSNYDTWDLNGIDQEQLFMATVNNQGLDEVLASIAICDFDDFEELRKYKPWVAAFVVREDLRGTGVGTLVLELVEQKARSYGIDQIYLWTEGEKPFYQKRGYSLVEQLIKPGRVVDVLTKSLANF